MLLVYACNHRSEETTPPATHQAGPHYVGKEACQSCHAEKYTSFLKSEMGRSFKPATLTSSIAQWEGVKPLHDPVKNLSYQPFHRGEDLFVHEYRIEGTDTVHSRIEKIDYIIGSGQHTNSHISEVNGYLYQMPLTYYAQDQRWDLPPGFDEGNNTRFEREIKLECMSCHDGLPDYVEGSGNRYTAIPHGIECERCHGPASEHIELMQSPKAGELADRGIVHPRKISVDRQFDICQRCHLQGTAVLKEGKSWADFQPGMELNSVLNVFLPRSTDSLDQFIMAGHPDRLRMSECFLQSHKEDARTVALTCINCHDPHVSIHTLGEEHYNAQCQSCHFPKNKTFCALDAEQLTLEGYNCIKCHMPKSGSSDIPHVRITDHNIRIPDQETPIATSSTDEISEFVRLMCMTEARPSAKTMAEGYLAYYEQFKSDERFLDSVGVYLEKAKTEQSEQDLSVALVRYYFLKLEYPAILGLCNRIETSQIQDDWTLYRIGEAYLGEGNPEKAVLFFERAVAKAPDHLKFRNKLSSAYISLKNPDRALEILSQVVKDNPKYESAWNNLGFAHVLRNDFAQAEPAFKTAISLNPDAEKAIANLASLYLNTGRGAQAVSLVERLVKLAPGNAKYRQFLSLVKGTN